MLEKLDKDNQEYITSETLKRIRDNTDWRQLFSFLDIEKDEKKSKPNDWWGKSPFREEKTSSFHVNDKGFFCFSTGEGGGVIELVQKFFQYRHGQEITCYDAGKWLLENNLSSVLLDYTAPQPPTTDFTDKITDILETPQGNKPIEKDLIPLLSLQGEHEQFINRNISKETCKYLGCGYLEKSKSPLKGRIVFQIRGVQKDQNDNLKPVILSHIGRATTPEQEKEHGKWFLYKGFSKSLELYNIDKLLFDQKAIQEAQENGRVFIVEGCFDIAKLIEAGIHNAISTLGAHISEPQLEKIKLITQTIGNVEFVFWYDRDEAGQKGQQEGIKLLRAQGYRTGSFNWDRKFLFKNRGKVSFPETIHDVCDFKPEQLKWLKERKII